MIKEEDTLSFYAPDFPEQQTSVSPISIQFAFIF